MDAPSLEIARRTVVPHGEGIPASMNSARIVRFEHGGGIKMRPRVLGMAEPACHRRIQWQNDLCADQSQNTEADR